MSTYSTVAEFEGIPDRLGTEGLWINVDVYRPGRIRIDVWEDGVNGWDCMSARFDRDDALAVAEAITRAANRSEA